MIVRESKMTNFHLTTLLDVVFCDCHTYEAGSLARELVREQIKFLCLFLRNFYLRQAMPILKAVPSSNYLQSRSSSP